MPLTMTENTKARLVFDPEGHKYFLDGNPIPGVTELLGSLALASSFDGVDPEYLKYKAEIGTAVHMACDLLDRGELDESSVDPLWSGYVCAYKRFLSETGFQMEQSEIPLFMESPYPVAGTVDKIGKLGGKRVLMDLKTGMYYPGQELQVAAYSSMYDPLQEFAEKLQGSYLLFLKKDGKYKLHPVNVAERGYIFQSAVILFYWKEGKIR